MWRMMGSRRERRWRRGCRARGGRTRGHPDIVALAHRDVLVLNFARNLFRRPDLQHQQLRFGDLAESSR